HGRVWSVAWSPDGTRLAVGSADGTIRLAQWPKQNPQVRVIKAHEPGRLGSAGSLGVRTLAWSPRGDRLASAGADQVVKIWDPIRGAELARLQGGHQFAIFRVAWSPDGKRLVSAGADFRIVNIWDVKTEQKLWTMRGHNDWVQAVTWSP